jgi:hypothetical protein
MIRLIDQKLIKKLYEYKDGHLYHKGTHGRAKQGNRAGVLTNGYIQLSIYGEKMREHTAIWIYFHDKEPKFIDHINGIRDDNRIENLRDVLHIQNCQNQKRKNTNTSGYTGVRHNGSSWEAYIMVNYKKKHLGSFGTIERAIRAREQANIKYNFHPNHGRE